MKKYYSLFILFVMAFAFTTSAQKFVDGELAGKSKTMNISLS